MIVRKVDYWKQTKAAMRNPAIVIGDAWDFLGGWLRSRRWSAILFLAPFLLLPLACVGLVAYGKMQATGKLTQWYARQAEKEAPADPMERSKESQPEDATRTETSLLNLGNRSEEEKSDKAFVYFRRVMDLESENKQARYYVATRLANRGAVHQARRMMESIAPTKSDGYAAAHAWLALDLYNQRLRGIKINPKAWLHHLDVASRWSQVAPALQMLYAKALLEARNPDKAVVMAQEAAKKNGALALEALTVAKAANFPSVADSLSEQAIRFHNSRIDVNEANDGDFLAIAQTYAFQERLDLAVNFLKRSLAIDPSRPLIRRALSNILTEQFRRSVKTEGSQFTADFTLLQEALSIDPLDPMIGEEIARLAYQKVVLTDGFQHALRRQLAEGKATTVTHILLANSSIKAENYPAAQRHLEIAHQISPNATVVMNNLAMVLTHVDPPDLERARELIDRVVQLDPRNHDYQDSRGKILAKAGELNAAVAAYEKCLSMQPNRIDSRQELAKIYEQLGLPEMAEAQRQIIAKLSKPAEAP